MEVPTGASFVFGSSAGNLTAKVVGLKVETPTADIVDMSGISDGELLNIMVPTGSWRGGSISVDYIDATVDPQGFVRSVGTVTFAAKNVTVSKKAILESAARDIRVGDVIRGTLTFKLTDYAG